MKRIVWAVLLLLLVSMLAACGDDDDTNEPQVSNDDRLRVAATTMIIADLARNVAGDRANITALIPAGADPHDFEPTPADVERVADAEVVLEHGLGLDSWASDLIAQSGTSATAVEVTTGVATIASADHDDDEDHDHDHDVDPHVWFDVANAKVMVGNIRDALIEADPDGREAYEANATGYLAELDELDGWIREQVATVPEANRLLVTSHEAFGYFVAAYGFEYIGAVIPSLDSQAQASAKQVEALLTLIEERGVRAIFTETTVNPDLTEQIAAEADITIVTDLYSDSLADDSSEASTYVGMMRHNTTSIVEALR